MMSSTHSQLTMRILIEGPFSRTFLLTGWLWPPLPQLAMTHPSHHLNFGMNPDHARNSLSNCGIRQPKYGDRKVHHMYMRKKGGWLLFSLLPSMWPQPLSSDSAPPPSLGDFLFFRHQHFDQHHVPPGTGRPLPLQVCPPGTGWANWQN